MEYIRLRNGLCVPQIGLGTWRLVDRKLMKDVVSEAYRDGYRLIDTAAAYSNEIAIAKAVAENEIPRQELMISDKVWNTSRGYLAVQDACKSSVRKLKADYLDLYLIHWPASMKLYENWAEINADTWRGMERLYKDGYVRAIGVCNFKIHHLEQLKKSAEIMPMVDQVELHPGMRQSELLEYCHRNQIAVEASSPLGNGVILSNEILSGIADTKGKSVAQIILKWGIQQGVIVIPKASKAQHLKDNLSIYDFDLSDHEMKMIDEIPYCGGIGIDPDEVMEFG